MELPKNVGELLLRFSLNLEFSSNKQVKRPQKTITLTRNFIPSLQENVSLETP